MFVFVRKNFEKLEKNGWVGLLGSSCAFYALLVAVRKNGTPGTIVGFEKLSVGE